MSEQLDFMNIIDEVNCKKCDEPMENKGVLFGMDVLGHFALELYACPTDNIGKLAVIGKLKNGSTDQWLEQPSITKLEQLMDKNYGRDTQLYTA